uniref:Protein Wnt n=1 Tax=Timema cristinae TaxID=61476 RepID=A0A7R9DI01_TIMCR|nr:unnamed protein product [Timema cristinae]
MPSTQHSMTDFTAVTYRERCHQLTYLAPKQQELCARSEGVLPSVGHGARMGIDECQYQFRMSRWNCTTFGNTTSVFGGVLAASQIAGDAGQWAKLVEIGGVDGGRTVIRVQ